MAIITLNNRAINRSDTASSGQVWTATSATAADFQDAGGGITGAQNFRTTGDTTVTTGSNTLITNWEAIDETSSATIGTSVSHSSGTFTIGATGIWLVQCQFAFKMTTTNRYFSAQIQFTADAWSSTQDATNTSGSSYRDSGTYYQMASVNSEIFDVTHTSNCQVRFQGSCEQTNGADVTGSTSSTQSWCSFIRLGDT
mgnify:CR=1 FL=1|tara:strand:- start:415 stop:1008 length:594 start_codon:yes stop_codon:yes gene_type:complete